MKDNDKVQIPCQIKPIQIQDNAIAIPGGGI